MLNEFRITVTKLILLLTLCAPLAIAQGRADFHPASVAPVATVMVAGYHAWPISVAGAVRNPLTFQASGPVTLLEAITRAGGLTAGAGSEILVSKSRAGTDGQPASLIERVSVQALVDGTDADANTAPKAAF